MDKALEYVSNQNTWSYFYTNTTKSGTQIYYRCNVVKRRSLSQYPVAIYLWCLQSKSTVFVYRTQNDHLHTNENVSKIGLRYAKLKKRIDELFKNGVNKPKKLIEILDDENFDVPCRAKIANYIKRFKKKKYGNKIHLGSLNSWLIGATKIREDDDERNFDEV